MKNIIKQRKTIVIIHNIVIRSFNMEKNGLLKFIVKLNLFLQRDFKFVLFYTFKQILTEFMFLNENISENKVKGHRYSDCQFNFWEVLDLNPIVSVGVIVRNFPFFFFQTLDFSI